MFIGSLMLFKSPIPILEISWPVVIAATATTALFFLFAIGKALQIQRSQVTTGKEGLVGCKGIAIVDFNSNVEGNVKIEGEIWSAVSKRPITKGDKIVVKKVEGLQLEVEKINQ
jgi:membrane-bound serine protease (ClpP class)